MVIIWRRWGLLVIVLALLGLGSGFLLHTVVASTGLIEPSSHRVENLFAGFGWLLGAAYIWLFDRFVNERHLDKPRLYHQTVPLHPPQPLPNGQWQYSTVHPVLLPPRPSALFFVPFKYWSIVFGVLGVVVIAVNAIRSGR
jgi:hypothetical protein